MGQITFSLPILSSGESARLAWEETKGSDDNIKWIKKNGCEVADGTEKSAASKDQGLVPKGKKKKVMSESEQMF